MRGGTRFWKVGEAGAERGRVTSAIRAARSVVPMYGVGPPVTRREIDRLVEFVGLRVHVARAEHEMDAPAVLLPPIGGSHRLVLSASVGPDLSRYIVLHEIGHILSGDADELTFLRFAGALPEAEWVADLFALFGVIDEVERSMSSEWLTRRVLERVPFDDPEWRDLRVPRLARMLRGFPLPGYAPS